MSPTHPSPAPDQKPIVGLEAAARTALESIADRCFTDDEWQQLRSRLVQFAHLLRQWSQPVPAKDCGEPIAFPRPAATPQPSWNEAA